jgi:hypothetical protein
MSWEWKYSTPIILVPGGLRQEDLKFRGSLGYIVRPCLRNKQTKTYKKENENNVSTI